MFRRKTDKKHLIQAETAYEVSMEDVSRVREKSRRVNKLHKALLKIREENHLSPRIRAAYEGEDRR